MKTVTNNAVRKIKNKTLKMPTVFLLPSSYFPNKVQISIYQNVAAEFAVFMVNKAHFAPYMHLVPFENVFPKCSGSFKN